MGKKILNIAICGAPNAGKSTFLNTILKEKISIVSPKVQTTRSAIKGILNIKDTQIIFTDTPGIFRARKNFTLEKKISNFAWKVIRASSIVILMIDGMKGLTKDVEDIIVDFKKREKKVITVITKIDKLSDIERLNIGLELEKQGEVIEAIFYISSITEAGFEKLTNFLLSKAINGEWIYSEDVLSDISESMTVSEILREKIFLEFKEEIPYHTSVQTESFDESTDEIFANVLVTVTKKSQKIIMIGKNGIMLKKIKKLTEDELSLIFNKKTKINIFIKIREDWREGEEYYKYMKIES